MKIRGWVLCFCGVLWLDVGHAANIQRTCQSYYEIERVSSVVSQSRPVMGVEQIIARFGHFTSTGGCGRNVPNRCRERASNNAQQCMQTHWSIPPGASWFGCSAGVSSYPIRRDYLRGAVQDWVCSTFKVQEMSVRLKAVTTGDKGCPRTSTLADNFRILCDGR
ncbi:MAG: hypothetical protein KJ804_18785 [Proteobacteria bacterium]|nr:hypothetical protein [Pseudomonadota bacterium]MBU1060355.1 hypothetical protein [Pseudomonadota bacterium]